MPGKMIATRDSYGKALAELGKMHEDIVVIDADLASSTRTMYFQQACPERFVNCGIAEQNMMGIAAGIATTGVTVFASSFAMFACGRGYEQIRNSIGLPRLNVKIGATHAGISVGADGGQHQCIEDIALMRVIPGMVVLCPADDVEARAAVRAAYEHKGPVYLRFGRDPVPVIHDDPAYHFELGRGIMMRDGSDVTIAATGLCVANALMAADLLAARGISAQVIDIHTIKPIDKELLIEAAKKTGRIVTVEEHSVIGGLGDAVSEALGEHFPVPMKRLGVQDVFGESGTADDLIHKHGLDAEGIAGSVEQFLAGKEV